MRTGILLPTTAPGTTGADLAAWAQKAEAAGFDSLGVVDPAGHDGYEPFIALTLAAAVTERVELVGTIRIGPLRTGGMLAEQAASLDRLSRGRLTLGLGVDLREDGVPAWDVDLKVRAALLDDHVGRLAGHRMLVVGDARSAARRLLTAGDGWAMTTGSPDRFAAGYTAVRDAWACAGRAGEPRGMAVLHAALGREAERLAAHGPARCSAWLGPEISGAVATTPDAVSAHLDGFAAAGATDVLVCPCSCDLAQLDLIADAALRVPALL